MEPVLTCNLFWAVDRHRGLQIESQGEHKLACANLYRFICGLADKTVIHYSLNCNTGNTMFFSGFGNSCTTVWG